MLLRSRSACSSSSSAARPADSSSYLDLRSKFSDCVVSWIQESTAPQHHIKQTDLSLSHTRALWHKSCGHRSTLCGGSCHRCHAKSTHFGARRARKHFYTVQTGSWQVPMRRASSPQLVPPPPAFSPAQAVPPESAPPFHRTAAGPSSPSPLRATVNDKRRVLQNSESQGWGRLCYARAFCCSSLTTKPSHQGLSVILANWTQQQRAMPNKTSCSRAAAQSPQWLNHAACRTRRAYLGDE